MNKIKLTFMVVPEKLKELAYVPNKVRVKIIDPEAIFLLGILGESGRELVKAGVEFYFEEKLAKKLIQKKIASKVNDGGLLPSNEENLIAVKQKPQKSITKN